MSEALPTSPDDERLSGWYHTVELGDGLVSKGIYDHRPIVDCYGLPESLRRKTALDVGTSDGFWAFELERRGADRVVAIDIPRYEDFDWLPWIKESLGARGALTRSRFDLAHAMRRSRVEYQTCSVYDLSPDRVGTFDVVFCGSLLLHLQNPLRALVNIRSVTRELAVIETMVDPKLDAYDRPWLAFGHRHAEERLGEAAVYWRFSTRALREMMEYAGFSSTQPLPPFSLPPAGVKVVSVIGYPESTASLGGPST